VKKTAGDLRDGIPSYIAKTAQGTKAEEVNANMSGQQPRPNQSVQSAQDLFFKKEQAKIQTVADFAGGVANEQERILNQLVNAAKAQEYQAPPGMPDPMLEVAVRETEMQEKEVMLAIWIAISAFAKESLLKVDVFVR